MDLDLDLDDQLFNAILESDYEEAKKLIENGADVDSLNNEGDNALYVASKIGDYNMIDLIIEHTQHINDGGDCCTAIEVSLDESTVEQLIQNGAIPDISFYTGKKYAYHTMAWDFYALDDDFREEIARAVYSDFKSEKIDEETYESYLELLCVQIVNDEIIVNELIDDMDSNRQLHELICELSENLGYKVKYHGSRGGPNGSIGFYFID